jgi:hypothetical protein
MGYLHDDGMNAVGYLGDEDMVGKETLTTFGRKYTRARLSRLLVSAHVTAPPDY